MQACNCQFIARVRCQCQRQKTATTKKKWHTTLINVEQISIQRWRPAGSTQNKWRQCLPLRGSTRSRQKPTKMGAGAMAGELCAKQKLTGSRIPIVPLAGWLDIMTGNIGSIRSGLNTRSSRKETWQHSAGCGGEACLALFCHFLLLVGQQR